MELCHGTRCQSVWPGTSGARVRPDVSQDLFYWRKREWLSPIAEARFLLPGGGRFLGQPLRCGFEKLLAHLIDPSSSGCESPG